jgi:hypothetical protein
MPKKKSNVGPSIDLSDDLPKELKVMVRSSVHELIAKYMEFYEHSKGSKPDKAKVVDGGLEKFFNDDKGFRDYLNGSAKRGVSPASVNQPSGS